MSRHLIWLLLLVVTSLVGCHDEEMTFEVTLSGAQEVPPVKTEAVASGTVTLLIEKSHDDDFVNVTINEVSAGDQLNKSEDEDTPYKDDDGDDGTDEEERFLLSANIDVSGVENVVAAHIHQGTIGENGPVAFAFIDNGDGTMSVEEIEITAEQADMLQNDEWYINVHTQQTPSGEVRGQIVGGDTEILAFVLSGRQEVPAVESDATGNGYVTVNTETNAVNLKVVTTGVEDAVAAHIHEGEVGENGGVVVFLEQSTDDPNLWQTPDGATLEDDVIDQLLEGGHYVNVHTPDVPSGELRGQILPATVTMFAFELDGEQEVPPVETDGSGDGYVWFDSQTNLLSVLIYTTDLDDAVAAHVHEGETGTNGGVIVELEQDGASTWRSPGEVEIDDETVEKLLSAGHYLNVHTPDVPSGEVRGQIE
ncbi:CHRD domain-containing protein [Photobacterium rosenbergii]|uniref:CHRD domain-containing protein n=1 Tax=Photobacterium rosenbergii TaxID=294936 RepID=UPI001C99F1AF|nr:CHRD domain-containing protein [Photobacterium rosenbergii]MBY5944377.1 CHRD domain-containing protein [Photobacterium rosenbergii]